MADAPFGALDADWRDTEAQQALALQQADAAKAKAAKRTWGDTARDVAGFPGRMIGSLAASPASPEADQAAMMPETFVNPLVKNAADAVGGAIASGAKAPGDALSGQIPQYDAEGHTSPEMIRRGFDTASIAGGGSVAGSTEALPAKLAADSAKSGAPIAAAEHAPPFYSGLEHAVAEHPQEVAPASQWAGTLANKPGVKAEERKYTGVDDFLAGKGDAPVTKNELLDHLENNKVQIGEVTKSSMPADWKDVPSDLQHKIADIYHDGPRPSDLPDWYEAIAEHSRNGNETSLDKMFSTPRYSDYQLHGGENYREKLLTLPTPNDRYIAATDAMRAKYGDMPLGKMPMTDSEKATIDKHIEAYGDNGGTYKSSHWDEPNVLAHLRMNDRDVTGAAGDIKPSTHIEEIQSDWHQAGRKQGYGPGESHNEYQLMNDQGRSEGVYPTMAAAEEAKARLHGTAPYFGSLERNDTSGWMVNMVPVKTKSGVPDAPFKKNWHELALKRALHEAAETGKDRISWTPGEAQAARYDLSKQVKEIRYNPDNEWLHVSDIRGNKIDTPARVPPEKLPDIIGKEAAERLINSERRPYLPGSNSTEHVLSGDGLKMGGDGMKGFYDKIVPDYLNKIGKPHGVQVKSGTTRVGDEVTTGSSGLAPVHYMDIPPSLRQQLLTKGMPLFEDSSPGLAVSTAEHAPKPKIAGNPNFRIVQADGGFDAMVGKRRVGRLLLQDEKDGGQSAFGVHVSEGYRRRGVASALYDEAEKVTGKKITPSNAQHEDGFQFWKGYRPDALAGDYRMRRDELIGKSVDTSHGPGKIRTVGSKGAIVDLDGKTATSYVPGKVLDQLLREDSSVGAGISVADHIPSLKSKKLAPASRSAEIPDIRQLPLDQAIATARTELHLIKAGDQSEGMYVGGPRDIQSKRALTALRQAFDKYVAADQRGGDWYDRYRGFVNEVTGGDPEAIKWMTSQHGQWSAGVFPEAESQFALKENNASIAGMPVKSARPAQHEAHQAAIEARDPSKYQLGKKTGEYARLISPIQERPPGATGVNDFRHARNFNYTEAAGGDQKNALTSAQHKFLDYETALAVDRANKTKLGGRSDWTGEKLQAAPWVRQKALDIQSRNPKLTYDEAFARANTTIADFADKHTAFATHEAHPGADTGHLFGSLDATPEDRVAYGTDPRSSWANAPGGRDAIYGGTGIKGTGVQMRVRPTTDMQGMYTPPGGKTELNPGQTARPLVAFDAGDVKNVAAADRALLNAGEGTRAYIDAQNAGAWHKPFMGGAPGKSNSLFTPMSGKATPEQMGAMREATAPHGLGDIADTGQGLTATSFWPKPDQDMGKPLKAGLSARIKAITGSEPQRAHVDSDIVDYTDAWKGGIGSGAATRQMLEHINQTPEIRAAFNNNPHIPQNALNRLARDEEWAKKWGAPREDIQNARRIIGAGPGWVDRLEAGLKKGAILPAIGAAILAPVLGQVFGDEGR